MKVFYRLWVMLWLASCAVQGAAAQSCQLPTQPDKYFDFDIQKDVFGINQTSATDYYKLALSWSPDYCQKVRDDIAKLTAAGKIDDAKKLQEPNQLQCFSNNNFHWVVHGLWSSSCDGKVLNDCNELRDIKKHPRFCKGDLAQLPYQQLKPFLCMTPSAELLQGEWEKHGACDFSSAAKYFKKTQALFTALKTPKMKLDSPELAQWMQSNNPKLAHKKLGFSKMEMYICYDKKFTPIDCPQKSPDIIMKHPSAEQVAQALNLSGHVEGGYYRRTYQADHRNLMSTSGGERYLMTSIYYMLTAQSPIGHFHLNQSDIMHYYHLGDAIRYSLIFPDGKLETVTMGSDVTNGQVLQLHVKGGIWKASELLTGEFGYGLISEAVSPGFDFADMTLGEKEKLIAQFPQHQTLLLKLTKY